MSLLLALVLAGGGLGAGGLQPPPGNGVVSSTASDFDGGVFIATSVTTPFLNAGVALVATLSIGNGSTLTNSAGTALFSAGFQSTGNTTANAFVAQGGNTTCFACAGTSIITAGSKVPGTWTLDGASPSKCTVTVGASAICGCFSVGTSAATAFPVAQSVTSTTLTCTAANGLTSAVNYICVN